MLRLTRRPTGIVPGEGVGVLVLKRLRDARRDGDQIHAIIRGIGAGHAESTTEAMQLAMNRAFQIAGVAPGDVALVEMDGIGLPQKDQEQLAAVLAAYGSAQRSEPLLVSTITGQIGHTAGVSAMASLMKASFEVETGQMPATFGLKNPLDIVAKNAQAIQVATQPLSIRHTTRDGRRFAAVSSFGKGQAYHILVERGQKVAVSAADARTGGRKTAGRSPSPRHAMAATPLAPAADSRIFRLGAATPAELTAKIGQALADASTAFAAAATSRFRPEDHSRLAIVAGNAESLARKLQLAAKQFANPDARLVLEQQGCFYRQLPVRRPRVAFVFPGQGSQYAGMLRELVRDVPAAAAAMREIDAVMTLRGYQTFAQMAWENPAQLGTDIWVTQIVMLLADLIMHAAVTDLGIRPDLVTGHSYGEFAALTAAGVWDLRRRDYRGPRALRSHPGHAHRARHADGDDRAAGNDRAAGRHAGRAGHTSPTTTRRIKPSSAGGPKSCSSWPICWPHAGTSRRCCPCPVRSTRRSWRASARFWLARWTLAAAAAARAAAVERHESLRRRAGRYSRQPGRAAHHAGALCRVDQPHRRRAGDRVRRGRTAAGPDQAQSPDSGRTQHRRASSPATIPSTRASNSFCKFGPCWNAWAY